MKGIIDDRTTYTLDALKQIGFSQGEIKRARQSGIVKPRKVGKKLVCRGHELNQWIESLPMARPEDKGE